MKLYVINFLYLAEQNYSCVSHDQNLRPVSISLNKLKLVKLLLGAVAFVGFGIWFTIKPSTFAKGPFGLMGDTGIIIVGWASIAFFGACAVIAFFKLLDNSPGLVVDGTGINDNSSGVSVGLITWDDITGLTVRQVYKQQYITILVKNPEEYISRCKNAFKRRAIKLNYQMYGSPINITSTTLKCSFDELYALLAERLETYCEANPESLP